MSDPNTEPGANAALVRRFFAAVGAADFEALDAIVAADYDDHRTGRRGRAALVAYFEEAHRALADLRLSIESVVAEGDRVMVRNRIVGVHRGAFGGLAPTGRPVDVVAMQEYRIANGRLAEHWEVADMLGLLQQLGATPQPATAAPRVSLFEPTVLGDLALPNRMVMAPMTRTRATVDGVPTPLMAQYYRQRASAGLLVTECTQVSEQGRGIIRAPGIHRDDQVDGWRRVVDAVHDAGGRIVVQLWHCGRVSHPRIRPGGDLPVAPSAIAATGEIYTPAGRVPFPVPRALDAAEIPRIIDDFGEAAANARRAGFDGVELHGAFGYLPDQFLQDGTNRRDDAWGGPVEHRARFLLEVVDAMAAHWGMARVGVKLSPASRHYGMHDDDARATFGYVIARLAERGVGYLHLMEPTAADRATGTVQVDDVAATFRPFAPRTPIIANGGFDRARAEAVLASGAADLVSFGVPFLANPDLPTRLARGASLNRPDPATFYGDGARGYTDYPTLAEVDT